MNQWGPNLPCFINRIAGFPDRLHNLYLVYSILFKSIVKLKSYLNSMEYYDDLHKLDETNIIKVIDLILYLG